jgi:DNA-binding CsgD family transcriptional regulator
VLTLGRLARRRGDLLRAAALTEESLQLYLDAGDQRGIAAGLHELAMALVAIGASEAVARLLGGVDALRDRVGLPLAPVQLPEQEQALAALRAALGASRLTALWDEGRSLTVDEMRELAARAGEEPVPVRRARRAHPAGLTEREVEVLRLVAEGLTNAQVADRLVISPRTVNFYLTTIYGKLGVSNRGAAIRAAMDQGIA